MPIRIIVGLLTAFWSVCVHAQYVGQFAPPNVGSQAVKVSEHVWVVYGFPNIGIVVGGKSVLVVDTGLGPKNGAAVAKIVQALAPDRKLYLTTTHFHPEHAAGDAGFPRETVLIRDRVQQQELEQYGQQIIDLFASRSAEQHALLQAVALRKPDVLFDSMYSLDLGGVVAQLLWFGGAHTRGDEMVFVVPDKTLVSGDIVQNKVVPNIFLEGGTPATWLGVLAQVRKLGVEHVVPDHSLVGDGSLVDAESNFISALQDRALQLKREGVGADEAGDRLTVEFKQRYSDWPISSVAGFVKSIYAE